MYIELNVIPIAAPAQLGHLRGVASDFAAKRIAHVPHLSAAGREVILRRIQIAFYALDVASDGANLGCRVAMDLGQIRGRFLAQCHDRLRIGIDVTAESFDARRVFPPQGFGSFAGLFQVF